MSRLPVKPVILGAGLAGLGIAWNFAQDGIAPTMIEKDADRGGLAKTFVDDGFYFDLGPHNFFPKYPDIKEFVSNLMVDEMYQFYPTAKILFKGRLVTYPLKGVRVLTALAPREMIPATINFVYARTKMFFTEPKEDDTFQDWITNRFGGVLYNIYFGPYAEKAWKIPGSMISDYVAIRRIPVISIRDHVRRTLGWESKNKQPEYGDLDNHYFKYGAGRLPERLFEDSKGSMGLLTRCEPVAIRGKKGRVESVTYRDADGRFHEMATDFLFSTIPLPDLIKIMDVDTPEDVKEAAAGLDFCAETLVYVKTKNDCKNIPSVLYFSDPEIKFNRLYNVGDWSRDCVPLGKSACCVEYTCNVGDGVWNAPPEELYEYTKRTLAEFGVIKEGDIEGFAIRRIEHAYPRFRVGFEDRLKKVFGYLSGIHNIITLGRQGLFSYANMDDVLHMAFRSYEAMNTMNVKGIDYYDLFPKYTEF